MPLENVPVSRRDAQSRLVVLAIPRLVDGRMVGGMGGTTVVAIIPSERSMTVSRGAFTGGSEWMAVGYPYFEHSPDNEATFPMPSCLVDTM